VEHLDLKATREILDYKEIKDHKEIKAHKA
jgi:hypothetical protein